MANHIIDKFTYGGETYILQDNQSGYATEGYVGAILENTVADVTVGGTSVVNADNVAVVPAIPTKVSDLTNDSGFISSYTETDPTVPSWAKASTKPSYTASEVGAVPTSRTVNGKALSSNISLTASDVGALPSTTTIPTVSIDQKTTSGTNIADITINGTTTQLYAPTNSGGGSVSAYPVNIPITKLTVSGVTINTLNITQCGYIVEVDVYIVLTGTLSSNTTIATGLPTPYRYPIRKQIDLFGSSYARPLRFLIEQDGSITIRYGTADTYYASFTYIAADAAVPTDADDIAY